MICAVPKLLQMWSLDMRGTRLGRSGAQLVRAGSIVHFGAFVVLLDLAGTSLSHNFARYIF